MSDYCCPCGYEPPLDYSYQINNKNEIIKLKDKYDKKNHCSYPVVRLKNKDIYPKIENTYQSPIDGAYSWGETHFCPDCKEEFSFSNGT